MTRHETSWQAAYFALRTEWVLGATVGLRLVLGGFSPPAMMTPVAFRLARDSVAKSLRIMSGEGLPAGSVARN